MRYKRIGFVFLFSAYCAAVVSLFCVFPKRWPELLLTTLPLLPCIWRINKDRKERKIAELCAAIALDDGDKVKAFLTRNININYIRSPNFLSKRAEKALPLSPFQTACRYGKPATVRAMVDKNPDYNKPDPYRGKTPLEWAMADFDRAPADKAQIILFLLQQGAATAGIDFRPLFQSVLRWAKACSPEDTAIPVNLLRGLSDWAPLNRLFDSAQEIYETENSALIEFMRGNRYIL